MLAPGYRDRSCFIGGNIAENSGGPKAVKYGVVKDYVLNLEIVLPDGEIIWTGANVLKNATGYNLTQLIVGSEGTLGIVTKIVLKLIPLPKYDRSELRFIQRYMLLGDTRSTFLVGTRVYKGLTDRKQGDGDDGSGPSFSFEGGEPNKSSYRFPGTNVAAFAENIFQLNRHWSITPGLRYEFIDTKAKGYYYKQNIFIPDEKIDEESSNPRSFVLLGIGTSWKFNRGMELYANISQNYRSINFNDMRIVNANAVVDPGLKDERGYNIDMGFRGTYRNWLYVDVSAFYLSYKDRIDHRRQY